MNKEVNNCGLACPQPVINTKRALDEIESGVVVSIVDNQVAKENVTRFAQNAGYDVSVAEKDNKFIITITKGEGVQTEAESDEVISCVPAGGTIYLITTDSLGQGSPELGYTLMKSFFASIKETKPAPAALIFMNSGVKLACSGCKMVEDLLALQQKGTEILACGTCLDYYKIKEQLAVGKVSNMFEIVEKMGTGKVITIA
ncbi:tRNA 2-thiouridine synthesizing protein A [Desulfohalotomaculum tongense]|uniref:sulfurtransferase-like selenium metabolism protein YedF n=1 Tax=Desulforadius tongensis TaxID=1216062 RepID=UPI00195C47F0|nr:tRNA 2-thiouridine synthesizing protein A [Desulforadius tongensis]